MVQSLCRKTITFTIAVEKKNKRCRGDRCSVNVRDSRSDLVSSASSLQCRSIATDIVRFSSEECMRSLDSAVSRCNSQLRVQACEKARTGFSQSFREAPSISYRQEIVRVTRLPFAMQSELHVNAAWSGIVMVVYMNQKLQRWKSLAFRQKTRDSVFKIYILMNEKTIIYRKYLSSFSRIIPKVQGPRRY